MITKYYWPMELPIMVDIANWFDEWPTLYLHSGAIIPEEIPDGVLWADEDHVMLVGAGGMFIQVVGA